MCMYVYAHILIHIHMMEYSVRTNKLNQVSSQVFKKIGNCVRLSKDFEKNPTLIFGGNHLLFLRALMLESVIIIF